MLPRTTFIAITGSLGKTTCKECLAAILSQHYPTTATLGNQNDYFGVARTMLKVRPWHRFAVVETGSIHPGMMHRHGWVVKPHIAIMLTVKRVHAQEFRSLESTIAEKSSLLAAIRKGGIAVLNGDDPIVAAMPVRPDVRVCRFGATPGFDCVAQDASAIWPERLRFRLTYGEETHVVQTKLVGVQWIPSVLAAITTAVQCGISVAQAVSSIEGVEPFMGRMQPVALPSGATMIRDEKDGQLPGLQPALTVLGQARGVRRVLVTSDYSDTNDSHRDRLRILGREAAKVADVAVFVDTRGATACQSAIRGGLKPENAYSFVSLPQAAEFLRGYLQPGDLVLLKGRCGHHLSRLYFAQLGTVGCWRTKCQRLYLCDVCPELKAVPDPVSVTPPAPAARQEGRA